MLLNSFMLNIGLEPGPLPGTQNTAGHRVDSVFFHRFGGSTKAEQG